MRSNQYPQHRWPSGFTLVELMIGLAVLAILVAVAAPTFREISLNNRGSNNVNLLIADLAMARSEALKVARNATVSALGGDWNSGWQVFVDLNGNGQLDVGDTLLKTEGPINPAYASAGNMFELRGVVGANAGAGIADSVTFGSMGQTVAPASGVRFALCRPDGDASKSSGIRVELSGRAQAVRNLGGLGLGCS